MVDKGLSIPIQYFEFIGEEQEDEANKREELKSDLVSPKVDSKRSAEIKSKHPLGLRPYSKTKKLLFNQSANPRLDLKKLRQESYNSISRKRLNTDRITSQKKLLKYISSSNKNSRALLTSNHSQNYQTRRKIQFEDWVQRAKVFAKHQIIKVYDTREMGQTQKNFVQSTRDILEVNGHKQEHRALAKIGYSPKSKKVIKLDLRKLLTPK